LGVALDEPKKDEKPVDIDGVQLLISDVIRPFVDGAKIDYGRSLFSKGFTVSSSGLPC
jgi:Fe-S cluster assembly iron-binding protein IscA